MSLKNVIEKNKITQAELANKAGINRGTLTRIFNSGLETAKLETIIKICKVLNCSINDIFPEINEITQRSRNEKRDIVECKKCVLYSLDEVKDVLNGEEKRFIKNVLEENNYHSEIKPREHLVNSVLKVEHFSKLSDKYKLDSSDVIDKINKMTEHQVYSIIKYLGKEDV
jgi:DNA-binding Xre family transcriptional regulator